MKVKFVAKIGKYRYYTEYPGRDVGLDVIFPEEYIYNEVTIYRKPVTTDWNGEIMLEGESELTYQIGDCILIDGRVYNVERVYKDLDGVTCVVNHYSYIDENEKAKEDVYNKKLESLNQENFAFKTRYQQKPFYKRWFRR